MLEKLRTRAYGLLRSTAGQDWKVVKFARIAANLANDFAGRPLATEEELAGRATYAERVAGQRATANEVRAKRAADRAEAAANPGQKATTDETEVAPVVVYTDAQSHRDLKRIADVLRGRDVAWVERSIIDDEATRSWVVTTAKTKEFPLVFIAGQSVGGFNELVELDANGGLVKKVFGRN